MVHDPRVGPGGLENGSRRPKKVRQPQTPPEVVQRILELREENPGCGREELYRLLLAEGISISSKRPACRQSSMDCRKNSSNTPTAQTSTRFREDAMVGSRYGDSSPCSHQSAPAGETAGMGPSVRAELAS